MHGKKAPMCHNENPTWSKIKKQKLIERKKKKMACLNQTHDILLDLKKREREIASASRTLVAKIQLQMTPWSVHLAFSLWGK